MHWVLIHPSKVFDCLKHDLLIAKIAKVNAFGFSCKSLWVIYTDLNNRVQVTKVGSYYSGILDIIFGIRYIWYFKANPCKCNLFLSFTFNLEKHFSE